MQWEVPNLNKQYLLLHFISNKGNEMGGTYMDRTYYGNLGLYEKKNDTHMTVQH